MNLVIVESPSKAKTLKSYLSNNFEVVASIGHFRDLPKSGMGIDEEGKDFEVKNWVIDSDKIKPVIKLIKKSDTIYLATDPDREGELIAWHIYEFCKEKKITSKKNFKRIEFNQVSKDTVLKSIENPRELDYNLVNAALARRFLDRFFGYKISPITQRRTIFGKSAGRVQSPALRILSEREKEIELFKPEEFWDITVNLKNKNNQVFEFKINIIDNQKIYKHSIKNKEQAEGIKNKIINSNFIVDKIEKKLKKRNPYAPFSTSTLQQDASNKLNFSPSMTNSIAQQLFDGTASEGGLITYIRTDSVTLPMNIIKNCRKIIETEYGENYLSETINLYKSKTKNAQEAHEPIRPIDLSKKPESVLHILNENQYKLYKLIWERTIASQMKQQVFEETSVFVKSNEAELRISGNVKIFDGFRKVYKTVEQNNDEKTLPKFLEKELLTVSDISTEQNFTKPPKRYSEAGLIKQLENLGIGRPSTYASIILKLKEKNYVDIKNKTLTPNSKGRILSKFLENFFTDFVDYEFTAKFQEQLDKISTNSIDWKSVLNDFLLRLNKTVSSVEKKSMTDVINEVNENSSEFFINRECPKCKKGELTIKFSITGPFIGCNKYEKGKTGCNYTSSIGDKDDDADFLDGEKIIGNHPETNKIIRLKKGKYGPYVELDTDDEKPKRASIPKGTSLNDVDLEYSISLLKLPRTVGKYPENGEIITASIGPYGPYLKYNNNFISLKDDNVLEINNNRAIDLIKEWEKKNKVYEIGENLKTEEKIFIKKGRYGRFFEVSNKNGKKKRVAFPKDLDPENISLDDAIAIIKEKENTNKNTKKK